MCRWLRLVPGPPSRSSLGRSELAEQLVQVIQWHLADVGQLQAIASDGLEELSAAWQSRQQCLRGHGGRRVRVEAHEDAGEQARQRRTVEVVAGALKALEEIADIGSD